MSKLILPCRYQADGGRVSFPKYHLQVLSADPLPLRPHHRFDKGLHIWLNLLHAHHSPAVEERYGHAAREDLRARDGQAQAD